MKKLVMITILVFLAISAKAQNNPYQGYVITNNGDTLRGMLDLESNKLLTRRCKFKANGETEYKTYLPSDIQGFRFENNGKYFVSRRFNINNDDQLRFAEFLVQGNMNLYTVIADGESYYFFERSDGQLVCVKDVRGLDENTYRHIVAQQTQSMSELKGLMSASQKAKNRLYNNFLTKQQYVNIVKLYHEDTCRPGEECIVYEYKESSEHDKPHFKVVAGASYIYHLQIEEMKAYPGVEGVGGKAVFTVGIGADFPLEKVLRDLYADATLLWTYYSAVTSGRPEMDARSKVSIFNLNIGGKYYLKHSGVRPFFGAGASLLLGSHPGYKLVVNGGESKEWTAVNNKFAVEPYVCCGVTIPVGKHAVNVRLDSNFIGTVRQAALKAEFVL